MVRSKKEESEQRDAVFYITLLYRRVAEGIKEGFRTVSRLCHKGIL